MNLDDFDIDEKLKRKILKMHQDETQGLVNKRDELMEKFLKAREGAGFGDFDTEALGKMLKQFQNQEEANLLKTGKIDELIALKVGAVQADLTQKLEAALKRGDAFENELNQAQETNTRMQIENKIRLAAGEVKDVLPTAVEDIVTRALRTWKIAEGKLTAYDGEKQLFNEKSEPLKPGEWIETMRESAPHYFGKGSGTGAGGAGGGNAESYEQYYDRKNGTFNLTKQAELSQSNPELHKQLREKYAQGATH